MGVFALRVEQSVDPAARVRKIVKVPLSVTAWQDFFVSVDPPLRYSCVSECLRLENACPSHPKSSKEELSLSHWHLVNENLRCQLSRVTLGELL